jgi:hypothetical protein
MPKYTLEIGGKTYDIESERSLSDSDLAAYARQIGMPQQAQPSTPPGQIPGAGPYQAPPAAEIPVGRRVLEGMKRNVGQMARVANFQPSAEMLATAGGAVRGAAAMAPAGPVPAAIGGVAGGIAGFTGARTGAELLQGQQPDVQGAVQEAVAGELIGRGAASAIRAGARGLDYFRSIPQNKAVNIARQAAGPEAKNIRAALQGAEPGMTPAQATAKSPRQAWQALLAFEPTDFAADVARRQQALSQSQLAGLAGGLSATAARETAEAGKQQLNAITSPMRETELAAANEAQRVMNALVPRRQQKQTSMVSALQEAGRTGTEAAQRTESAVQQLQRVVPGQIPSVSARQTARVQAAAGAQQQEASNLFADISRQRRAERDFIDRQIGSLEAYGLRPLDINPVVQRIDTTLNTPGIRASTDVTRVMSLLKDDLLTLAQRNGGVIDAHDLYTLRKEGVAQRVRDVLKQDDPKAAAKVTAAVVDKFRPLIDNAIEQAGGTGWRQYLDTYSKGMDVIARKQMAAQALDMFKGNPQDYVRLVRGDNPDAVEAIFGPGRYSIFKEMTAEMPTLDKVARIVEADKLAAEKAAGGRGELAQILEANRAKLRLPNWFSPTITAANMRLADVEKRVDKKTIDMIRKAAESNQGMIDLLDGLPVKERQKLLRLVTDISTSGVGQAVIPAARAAVAPTIGELSRKAENALAPEPINALTAP